MDVRTEREGSEGPEHKAQSPASSGARWWTVAVLLAAGFGLRAAFVHWHRGVSGDSLLYGDIAQNMLRHHVYGFTEPGRIRPTLIRLPGYPAFLAACFAVFGVGNYRAAEWVQVVVDMAGWCLLARMGQRLWGERAGLAALALGMLCPFVANYCAAPLTETLVMFCAVAALFGLERWVAKGAGWNAWMWVAALALVYGILLRPDQVLMAVAVVAGMAVQGSRSGVRGAGSRLQAVWPVLGMCAVMATPFLLWAGRNWMVFHVVQPLAPRYATDPGEAVTSGFNRWYRTWGTEFVSTVEVYWNWDGSPVSMKDLPQRAIDNAEQRRETERLFAMYAAAGASTPEIDAGMMRLAEERIREKPLRYAVWVPALKVADMWLRPRTEFMYLPLDWWRFRAHERGSWECLGLGMVNLGYLALGVAGFLKWRRRGWDVLPAVMVGFIALRCVLLWTIDNSEPRYTLECFPMVILLAAVALGGFGQIGEKALTGCIRR